MDVNTLFTAICDRARIIDENALRDIDPIDAQELAEMFLNLDGWIRKGGFLPAEWRQIAA